QLELAARLSEAGATAVVGGHAHRVLGGGYAGGTYVHYGLGNFAFAARSPESARTGVLTLTVAGGRVVADEWAPGRIEGSTPVPLGGPAADEARAHWDGLRACTALSPHPG